MKGLDCKSSSPVKAAPPATETKLVRVSFRRGDSWRAAAIFFVPARFDEDQIEAAATPVAEALGQHELEITGSVDGLDCDIHVTMPDGRGEDDADPILEHIERCIRAAIEGATR